LQLKILLAEGRVRSATILMSQLKTAPQDVLVSALEHVIDVIASLAAQARFPTVTHATDSIAERHASYTIMDEIWPVFIDSVACVDQEQHRSTSLWSLSRRQTGQSGGLWSLRDLISALLPIRFSSRWNEWVGKKNENTNLKHQISKKMEEGLDMVRNMRTGQAHYTRFCRWLSCARQVFEEANAQIEWESLVTTAQASNRNRPAFQRELRSTLQMLGPFQGSPSFTIDLSNVGKTSKKTESKRNRNDMDDGPDVICLAAKDCDEVVRNKLEEAQKKGEVEDLTND